VFLFLGSHAWEVRAWKGRLLRAIIVGMHPHEKGVESALSVSFPSVPRPRCRRAQTSSPSSTAPSSAPTERRGASPVCLPTIRPPPPAEDDVSPKGKPVNDPGKRLMPFESLAVALSARRCGSKPLLIGVDGPGGSGKSTVARALADRLSATVVEGDDFYRPSAERNAAAFDAQAIGAGFDWERLRDQVLAPLAAGRPTRYQRYDWDSDQLGDWVPVEGAQPIIVEGVYTAREELRRYFDVTIWVEAPSEVRLARGLDRDGEASRSLWVDEWMPAEDRYMEVMRSRDHADLVADGSGTVEHNPDSELVVVFDHFQLPE
jgi:uridine kinase